MSSRVCTVLTFSLALAFSSASARAAVINATYSGTFEGWIAGVSVPGSDVINADLTGWLSIKEPTTAAHFNPEDGTTTYFGSEATPATYWATTAFTLSHATLGSWDYIFEFPVMQFSQSPSGQTLHLNYPFFSFKYQQYMTFTSAPGSLFSSSDPAKLNVQPSWADLDSAILVMAFPDQSGKGVITNMVFASPVSAPSAGMLVLSGLLMLASMRAGGGNLRTLHTNVRFH